MRWPINISEFPLFITLGFIQFNRVMLRSFPLIGSASLLLSANTVSGAVVLYDELTINTPEPPTNVFLNGGQILGDEEWVIHHQSWDFFHSGTSAVIAVDLSSLDSQGVVLNTGVSGGLYRENSSEIDFISIQLENLLAELNQELSEQWAVQGNDFQEVEVVNSVPEPSGGMMAGLACLMLFRRRR